MKYYKAQWDGLLIGVSSFLTLLCLGIAVVVFRRGGPWGWAGWMVLALVAGCALFTIRGYTVRADGILVHRLFWATWLPSAGLQSAQFEPNAMRRSLRIFGNGGFFSYSGLYWNKLLGSYRAFVTDRHQTVVLRYPGRRVVISPSAPEELVRDLSIARNTA